MVKRESTEINNRVAGALIGLSIGDALGAITEGMNPESIRKKYGAIEGFSDPSQMSTDDTEFTIFYAGLLHEYGSNITSQNVADHWLQDVYDPSDTYKGAGFSESLTIHNLKSGLRPPASGQHVHSWSDGLAMCATPFGCVCPGQPEKAAEIAKIFGQVSHAGEGIYGGMAVAAAIASAMTGATPEQIFESAMTVIPEDSWTYYTIGKSIEIGNATQNGQEAILPLYEEIACTYYHWSDLAPEAVGIAFGLLAAGKANYRNTVLAAVNLGRDADTIAAITGALCGCLAGYDGLPPEWRDNITQAPGRCVRSVKGVNILDVAKDLTTIAAGEKNG